MNIKFWVFYKIRINQAICLIDFLFRWDNKIYTAAGVIPSILSACPIVFGLIFLNFDLTSLDKPENIDYDAFSGLSNEVKSKFKQIRPKTMGQALRIDGITPAAAYILLSHLKRKSIKHIAWLIRIL